MNPKTGEILAMVSYPTYENNRMARIIPSYYYDQLSQDPRHPLLNNAVQSEYPPGSVFKLAAANGALNEGVVSGPEQVVFAPGKLELCEQFTPNEPCTSFNTRPFVDWIYDTRPEGFGQIDVYHCIAYSSNVCFYKLGGGFDDEIRNGGLGIFRLGEYARALGYGAKSGIQLPGEAAGLIPSPQWKRINKGENWSTGDTYIATVGQGFVSATPLQVLMSGETMANSGKMMQPTVIRQVTDSEGKVQTVWFSPQDFTLWMPKTVPDPEGASKQVWVNLNNNQTQDAPPEGSYQISPFVPNTLRPWYRKSSRACGWRSRTHAARCTRSSMRTTRCRSRWLERPAPPSTAMTSRYRPTSASSARGPRTRGRWPSRHTKTPRS
jgi:hypothetical protein